MAQLVMGAVGAVVGFYVGGPTGAAYGWSIGVALGGALDPQNSKTQGPRINDLKVQASSYGAAIPIVYGAMRVNGNVIFCTDKREVATETNTDAGKGGPTVTNTTYSYNIDIAIALCAGPIVGIRKIWSNGKLIYDQSASASAATIVASSTRSAGFKVYLGDEAQLPDPTLEAALGAGNVPAYRGTAYVVFTQLDCPNGQIPQLSFEVAAAAAPASANPLYGQIGTTKYMMAAIGPDGATCFPVGAYGASTAVPITRVGPGYQTPTGVFDSTVGNPTGGIYFYPVVGDGDPKAAWWMFTGSTKWMLMIANLRTQQVQNVYSFDPKYINAGSDDYAHFAYDPVSDSYVACMIRSPSSSSSTFVVAPSGVTSDVLETPLVPLAFYNGIVYLPTARAGMAYLRRYDARTGHLIDEISSGLNLSPYNLYIRAGAGGVYVVEMGSGLGTLKRIWKIAGGAWALLTASANFDGRISTNRAQPQAYVTDSYALIGPSLNNGTSADIRAIGYNAITPIQPTVANIIADICARAGLAAPQIDVSTLTGVVDGFAITNVSPARSNLDPLLKCFQIDAVESDGVLRFIKRSAQTSAASVPWTDLGASTSADDMPGDPAPLQRMQEIDLPRSVTVNFMNVDADYQSGTEASRRAVTASANDVVQELPVATNAAQAAAVAEALLYTAWNERNARTVKLPRSWAQLDPCDVITLEYPQGAFSAKRIVKATDDGATVELALVDADPSIYASTPPGATPGGAQAGVSQPPPTNLALLDIPILRDADDNPGLYAAMAGYGPGWPGAVLYGGADDAQLSPRGGVSQQAVIGFASTVLGNWTSNTVDETNTVTVNVGSGLLASTTRDNMLDNGANALLLGNEIIAFATATAIGGGQYVLSSLLRGARGTEWARGTHTLGERAVLLAMAGMLRPNMDLSALNSAMSWRAISIGLTLASQASTVFTNTGAGLKPFSPVNLRRSMAGNDITLTWDRRTRSSVTFPPGSGADVPLFEGSEKYQIDVYANNTFGSIVRSILSGLPQVTYTAAQQTADGLTPGAAVNVRIYQVSTNVGLGAPLQGTI